MNCKQLNTRKIEVSSSLVQDKKEFYVGQKKCLETLTVLVGALVVVATTLTTSTPSASWRPAAVGWCRWGCQKVFVACY